jgi:hypothetical protein
MRYLALLVVLAGCSRGGAPAPAARLSTSVPASGATVAASDGLFEVEFPAGTFPDGATVDVDLVWDAGAAVLAGPDPDPVDPAAEDYLRQILDKLDAKRMYRIRSDSDGQAPTYYRYRTGSSRRGVLVFINGEFWVPHGGGKSRQAMKAPDHVQADPNGEIVLTGTLDPPEADTTHYLLIIGTSIEVALNGVPEEANEDEEIDLEIGVTWQAGPFELRVGASRNDEGFWETFTPSGADPLEVAEDAEPGSATIPFGKWSGCPGGEGGKIGGTIPFTVAGLDGKLQFQLQVACAKPEGPSLFESYCHEGPWGITEVHPKIAAVRGISDELPTMLVAGDGVRAWLYADNGDVIHCESGQFVNLVTTTSVAIATEGLLGNLTEIAFLSAGSGTLVREVISVDNGSVVGTQTFGPYEMTDVSVVGNDPLCGQAVFVNHDLGIVGFLNLADAGPSPPNITLNQFPDDTGKPVTAVRKKDGHVVAVTDLGWIVRFDPDTFADGVVVGKAGETPRRIRFCGDLAFVTNEQSDSVTVVRWIGAAITPIGTIPVGDGPGEIALRKIDTPDGERIAMVTTGFDTYRVSVVDPANGTRLYYDRFHVPEEIPVGAGVTGCAWVGDTEFVISLRTTGQFIRQRWKP